MHALMVIHPGLTFLPSLRKEGYFVARAVAEAARQKIG
jgi:hypothetical protein